MPFRKKSKKAEIKELDEMWKQKVKDRDNWCCQVCKKKVTGRNCNAHHILPRTLKKTRWDTNNGMTLCAYHHTLGMWSAHKNAIWFYGWMNQNKKKQLKYIITKLSQYEKV